MTPSDCTARSYLHYADGDDLIIVTRHSALVTYLHEIGAPIDAPVIAHATVADVRGRHVIGVLPLHLAAEAESVTEVPLNLPPEARGRELTLEEVRQYAAAPQRYCVCRVEQW